MKGKFVVAFIALSALCALSALGAAVTEGTYNVSDYCNLVQPGTLLASTVSCSQYYSCGSNGPVLKTCGSGLWFNKATQTCVAPAASDCTGNPCAGATDGDFVAYGKDCVIWARCLSKKVDYIGYCPSGQVFAGTSCGTATCVPPTVTLPCAVVPPNVYFGSEGSCSAYQTCSTAGDLSDGTCTGSQSFDVTFGGCVNDSSCSQVTEASVGGNGSQSDSGSGSSSSPTVPDATSPPTVDNAGSTPATNGTG